MILPSDDSKAILVLTTRLGDRSRPSLPPAMWNRFSQALRDAGLTPADAFGSDLRHSTGIEDELASRVDTLLGDAAAVMVEVEQLTRRGIWPVTTADDTYPDRLEQRLGHNTPPVLFGVGNLTLLNNGGIGLVGSRNVTEAGARAAENLARRAVELGKAAISGGARGVDQIAMNASYQAGGSVVGVLADALTTRIRQPAVLEAIERGDTCLVTQQHPATGFTPASAMARNKIIYGLADVTVVVASDEGRGGTWTGAIEAIRATNGRVAVWIGEGSGPGNLILLKRGADPLERIEDLKDLLEALPPIPTQLRMLD